MTDIIQELQDNLHCPYCQAPREQIEDWGTSTTLVGYFGGPENDGNHRKTACRCRVCDKGFTKHWIVRDRSIWYTGSPRTPDADKCLEGTPTCCESCYQTRCTQPGCGGWVSHSRRGLSMCFDAVNGRSVSRDPMFWKCDTCGHEERDRNYLTREEAEALPPLTPPGPINFKVTEKLGVGYVNVAAIQKLNLGE